jgi:hypothetical protein
MKHADRNINSFLPLEVCAANFEKKNEKKWNGTCKSVKVEASKNFTVFDMSEGFLLLCQKYL